MYWLVMLEGFWAVGTVIVLAAAWATSLAGVRMHGAISSSSRQPRSYRHLAAPLGCQDPRCIIFTSRNAGRSEISHEPRASPQRQTELPPKARLEAPLMVTGSCSLICASARADDTGDLVFSFSVFPIAAFPPGYRQSSPVTASALSVAASPCRGCTGAVPGYALAAYGVEGVGTKKTLVPSCSCSAAACA